MSFKFGLNIKDKAPNALPKAGAKPSLTKKKPLLDDEDDDAKTTTTSASKAQEIGEFNLDDTLSPSTGPSKPASSKPRKGQPPAPPSRKPLSKPDDPTALANSASAKEAEQRAKEALAQDATIYDYDRAYDALHAATAAKKAAAQDPELQRRPKYMDSLLEAAELRKKDQMRAKDKALQRERENEGDEFNDKEKFVTGAYKEQQEETRRAEEEEKKRQEAEEEKRKKFGMQGFHKQMLLEREKRHQEAMDAAAEAAKGGFVAPAVESGEKTDAQIVEDLRKQGKDVLLNDEGQIADKRQLLSAGLNIIAKPKPKASSTSTSASTSTPATAKPAHLAPKLSRVAQRERQTEMIAQQIEAAAKRKADEEADEQAKLLHASKSQKTETDIMSAKERYLARKREKEAAKANAGK